MWPRLKNCQFPRHFLYFFYIWSIRKMSKLGDTCTCIWIWPIHVHSTLRLCTHTSHFATPFLENFQVTFYQIYIFYHNYWGGDLRPCLPFADALVLSQNYIFNHDWLKMSPVTCRFLQCPNYIGGGGLLL